jgi:hypothetical protein
MHHDAWCCWSVRIRCYDTLLRRRFSLTTPFLATAPVATESSPRRVQFDDPIGSSRRHINQIFLFTCLSGPRKPRCNSSTGRVAARGQQTNEFECVMTSSWSPPPASSSVVRRAVLLGEMEGGCLLARFDTYRRKHVTYTHV